MLLPLAHRSRIYTYLNELLSISQEIPAYTANSMYSQTPHYIGAEGCYSRFYGFETESIPHAHLQCVIPASPDVQLILQSARCRQFIMFYARTLKYFKS